MDEDETIKIRYNYGCINDHDMLKLKRYKKVDIDITVMGQPMTRKMAIVPLINKKTSDYEDWYVDTVTGTMYDMQTLRCNSPFIHVEKVWDARRLRHGQEGNP
jgi:hypothetical protein